MLRLLSSFRHFLVVLFFIGYGLVIAVNPVLAQDRVFTVEELAKYNGKDGNPAYTAYEGTVYDVTNSPLWKAGEHFGLQAGKDLTAQMANAPHGPEVFNTFTPIGVLEGSQAVGVETPKPEVTTESETEQKTPVESPVPASKWYSGRMNFLGISILGWTGILLGIFFVLTFATCFAMPWAQLNLPWVGQKPGPDPLDSSGKHLKWTAVHKHFVWVTVILGVIHGVLGFLQLVGVYL